MYIKANAANCLQVQLAAPEIMTEHRKSVTQDFISTCVQCKKLWMEWPCACNNGLLWVSLSACWNLLEAGMQQTAISYHIR